MWELLVKFESYYISIVISLIVTCLVWIRSKKWIRKKIKPKIHSKSDNNLYWLFYYLALFAHLALLISIVFFIHLINFII